MCYTQTLTPALGSTTSSTRSTVRIIFTRTFKNKLHKLKNGQEKEESDQLNTFTAKGAQPSRCNLEEVTALWQKLRQQCPWRRLICLLADGNGAIFLFRPGKTPCSSSVRCRNISAESAMLLLLRQLNTIFLRQRFAFGCIKI